MRNGMEAYARPREWGHREKIKRSSDGKPERRASHAWASFISNLRNRGQNVVLATSVVANGCGSRLDLIGTKRGGKSKACAMGTHTLLQVTPALRLCKA